MYRSPLRIGGRFASARNIILYIHGGPLAFGAMPKARQSAKTNPGMYSKGTKAKNAAEKKVHQDAVRAALAFTQFHGKSTVWAMKHGDFAASVTKNILDKALAGKLVYCNSDRREDSILTELEAERLITWIKGCAQNTNPALVGCTQGRMSMTGYTLRVGLRACGNPLREPTAHDSGQAPARVGCSHDQCRSEAVTHEDMSLRALVSGLGSVNCVRDGMSAERTMNASYHPRGSLKFGV